MEAEGILDRLIRPMAERVFFAGFWWGSLCGFLLGIVLCLSLRRAKALTIILPLVLVGLVYLATGGGNSPVPLPLLPSKEEPDTKPDKPKAPEPPRKPWRPFKEDTTEGLKA